MSRRVPLVTKSSLSNNESTRCLTHNPPCATFQDVPSVNDAVDGLASVAKHRSEQLTKLRKQLDTNRTAYLEYLDARRRVERYRREFRNIGALLTNYRRHDEALNAIFKNHADWGDVAEMKLRQELNLWEVLAYYLEATTEARVPDIQQFLAHAGVRKITKQAIESALRTHADIFNIRLEGREKFISLKG